MLKPKQNELMQLLIAGKTQQEAARILGIGSSTVQRWMALPHFIQAYKEFNSDISSRIKEKIDKLSDKALIALEESLQCKSSLVKFQASTYVLERVAPAAIVSQQQSQDDERIDPNLVPYMTNEERVTVIDILQRARDRKAEEEEKIIPIRKYA